MIDLKQILNTFSEDNQKEFLLYLDKKNKRKDAKNLQLTSLLLKNNYSSNELSELIYGKQNKVALHALRKRLFSSIINFTADTNIKQEKSIDIKLIKHILSARSFFEKDQIIIGYQILDKAEVIAKEQQLFTILNEIYHTKIQYSYANSNVILAELIVQFKENQQKLILEETLNVVYAKIRKALNTFQHYKSKIDIKKLIDKSLYEEGIADYNNLSLKSLYQILQIFNIGSFQKFDYWNIENLAIIIYKVVQNHKSKEKQLYYHIEIVYLISNIFFRNKKFTESFQYLKLMESLMKNNKQKYYSFFEPKYILLLSLNFNYSQNQEKAIHLLQKSIHNKNIDSVTKLDMQLSLIVFYYQKGLLKDVQKIYSKLYHTDEWYIKKVGIIWTIKKSLIEILLHIDLGNINVIDSRIKSFKRKYITHLREINQEKVITYLKLIEIYYKRPEIVTDNTFKEKVENNFNWIENDKEDIFMMSFFAWLKAKMTKQDLYLVTLQLIKG